MNATTKTRSNKATLFAAALIIALSSVVFGTLADEPVDAENQDKPYHQELTDEQKATLEEAKALFEAGDKEAAKELLQDAEIKRPHGKRKAAKAAWLNSLTDEQRELLEQAKELKESGDKEAAKELLKDSGIERPHFKKGRRGHRGGQR